MEQTLSGRRALVTGASRGIGKAVALELARAGADVVVHCASRVEAAEAVAAQIRELGRRAEVVRADLAVPEGAEGLVARCGDIDILVLNASVQIKKPWTEITRADFETQVNCNFYASMRLMQQAAPAMRERGWGRIVAVGSVQEAKPHPDMLVYSATKAAQTMMVRSLAAQLAPYGVTVNSIAPGVIYTDRNREALADPDYAAIVTGQIPMRFYGEPRDCAGVVRLLCGDEGRYITGQSIYIDGGKSL